MHYEMDNYDEVLDGYCEEGDEIFETLYDKYSKKDANKDSTDANSNTPVTNPMFLKDKNDKKDNKDEEEQEKKEIIDLKMVLADQVPSVDRSELNSLSSIGITSKKQQSS